MKIFWKHLLFCTLIILLGDNAAEKFPSDKDVFTQDAVTTQDDNDYRLPKSIEPSSYDISLMPKLRDTFTFSGIVKITAKVKEATESITLHVGNLEIISQSVLVDGKEKVITSSYENETEQYTLTVSETLEIDKEILIVFTYKGILSDNMIGFYKSFYIDKNGDPKWLAATQFQTTHARHAFPCFDEPNFKAQFIIRILRDKEYTSLSNMPINRTDVVKDEDQVWDVFEESPRLPTYLVAFVISEFSNFSQTSEIDFKVWARPSVIDQTKFALEIGPKFLTKFSEKFDQDHGFAKMDMVAIPDFAAGAMENWGLVTYRETRMLYDENESSDSAQQSVASVIAHELAHTWFGNMVTPEWWEYLWLSEGFARYYQYFGTALLFPDWKMEDLFVIEQHQSVLIADGVKSSKPLTRPVSNQSQVTTSGDTITYNKGASIIRMMDLMFGANVLEPALQNYIKNNKEKGLANPNDLWNAIQSEVDKNSVFTNIKIIMETWTKKAGYPVIIIDAIDDTSVSLTQERFLQRKWENTDPTDDTWWIPLTWTTQGEPNFEDTSRKKWMVDKKDQIQLTLGPEEWIIFNVQSSGFYRVNYNDDGWRRIFNALNEIDNIHVLSRAAIVDDLLNLGRAGYQDYETVLDGIKYLKKETNYLPFKAALNGLDYLIKRLEGRDEEHLFKNFVLSLIKITTIKLGYEDREKDDRLTVLLRRELNNWACNLGDIDCKTHYLDKFRKWRTDNIPIKPNERTTTYCTAIKYGDTSDWEFLWQKYRTSNYPTDQLVIMNALGCSESATIIKQYLKYATTDYEDSGIRKQDSTNVFAAVYNSGITGAKYVLDFVKENLKAMEIYYGKPDPIVTILDGASQHFSTPKLVKEFEDFVKGSNMKLDSIRESLETSLDIAKNELTWYTSNSEPIVLWLEKYNQKDEITHLPNSIIPNKYEIFVAPNFETGKFDGTVKIEAKVLAETSQIFLHSAEMEISRVRVTTNGWSKLMTHEIQKYDLLMIDVGLISELEEITIEISYTGTLSPSDLRGFYKSSYVDNDGKTRWLAATHLEPTGARKMFPCFDEPAMKARFKINVSVPLDYYAVSNMKCYNIIEEGNRQIFLFEESEKMSTYLVAVIISDFVINSDTNDPRFAVLARPNAINQSEYALNSIQPLVQFFQDTYGQEYQLNQLYMVALPDFPSGAGENWGLLTYRESNLLYDENHSTITSKQAIRNVIAHEISHQWFGNLVSPQWWEYLWLNEGFARYFEYHATARAFSDSTLESQFVVDEVHSALSVDSFPTHPLTHNVTTVSEIRSIFDTITYAKGASILRMLEKSFGTTLFNSALSDYLETKKYSTATSEDLYEAFQKQIDRRGLSQNITAILDTWTTQPGYPVVNVYVDFAKNNLTFEQERFLLKKEEDDAADLTWHIPITWTTIDQYSNYNTMPKFWLEGKNKMYAIQTSSLLICNAQRSGYYRVNYDKEYLWKLIDYFENRNINMFNAIDRAAFIDDLMNLARADSYVNYKAVISATMYLRREDNYLPWRAFFDNLPYLSNRFRGRHLEELYKKYLTHIIEPLYIRLSFTENEYDDDLTKMLRIHARKWACELDIEDCVYQATNSFKDTVSPNSRGVSYCTVMRMDMTGNSYDYLLEKYLNSNVASEKLDILKSLACSRDPDVLKTLLKEAIMKDSFIRYQDSAKVFSNVYSESLIGVETVMNFIETYYKEMLTHFDNDTTKIGSIVSSLASRLSTHDLHDKYENLINVLINKDDYFKNSSASYLSAAKYEYEWYEKKAPIIFEQLDMLFSNTKHRLPQALYPDLYDLHIAPYMEEGTFDGNVKISMKAQEETTSIVLNSHNLNISNVKVFRGDQEIEVLSYKSDDASPLLKIYLAKLINVGEQIRAEMSFSGILNDNMKGFYRSSYKENGLQHWLATTQFEPTHARDAFPCFDEPAFKSKFKISIQRLKHYNSLSNMPLESSTETDGYALDVFKTTDVEMPTYSVAFVISEFQPVNRDAFINVWGRPEMANHGKYAQDLSRKILDELRNITEIDYPLPKLDLVGIPDFAMGAMENWGLVTSREYGLFYNKRVTTSTYEKYIITLIAHELAHMWFGNLVTCEWWDYIWLNEGFAQYFEWFVANKIKPKYKFMDQFVVYELQPALLKDSSISAHSMTNPVNTPEEISGIFDYVTYGKSSCVLRMLFDAIGETVYEAALRDYLTRQETIGTANPTDLWKSFDPYVTISIDDRDANVEEVMSTWTDQPGYPVVNVTLIGHNLTLTQERFITDMQGTDNRFYWIPIHIITSLDDKGYKLWLGPKTKTVYINPLNEWVIVNYKQTGFYRVNYDKDSWMRLIDELNSDRFENIHVLNRAQIIDDLFNLAAASYVEYEKLLDASKYLVREKNHLPWKAFFNGLSYVYERFEEGDYHEYLQKYILNIILTLYNEVGFEELIEDEHLTKLNREILLQWACKLNNEDCVQKSKQFFKAWRESVSARVPLNAQPAVYCTAVREGDLGEFNFLWNMYLTANFGSEKKIMLKALGCSKDEETLQNYLREAITKYAPGKASIQRQDVLDVFSSVYSASSLGVSVALDFLTMNTSEVYDYFGNWDEIAGLFLNVASHVSSKTQYDKLYQFTESDTYKQLSQKVAYRFDSAITIAERNLLWYNEYSQEIGEWLKKELEGDKGISARIEPMNVIFMTLIALVSYLLSYR